ncbi:hypothetical protein KM043_010223 [Ampulex compressa]|nr:hypothetical protein KM043_010223 [Ampulex compressa]
MARASIERDGRKCINMPTSKAHEDHAVGKFTAVLYVQPSLGLSKASSGIVLSMQMPSNSTPMFDTRDLHIDSTIPHRAHPLLAFSSLELIPGSAGIKEQEESPIHHRRIVSRRNLLGAKSSTEYERGGRARYKLEHGLFSSLAA